MDQDAGRRLGLRRRCFLGLLLILCVPAFFAGCAVHPKIIDLHQVEDQAGRDRETLVRDQEEVAGPLSLEEAMARAVKYNRERSVRLMASALAQARMGRSNFDMWPELMASAGYTSRNNTLASESVSVRTNTQSLEPSTSTDDDRKFAEVSFAWNILDFGLSYVRAGQMADRYLIAKEQERKAIQTLIANVRQAWWEAQAAQRLVPSISLLEEKVGIALEKARQVEIRRLQDPLKSLNYQRSLLNMMQTLESLRRQFSGAKSKLASLMGLLPGTEFTLQAVGNPVLEPIDLDMDALEIQALVNRPELMESRYEERISERDVKVALLKLLPGITLEAGFNWDSNSFLVNQSWFDGGARIGWNLFNVFRAPKDMAVVRARKALTEEQRLAISMGVLMQVHLARVQMVQARKRFVLAGDYLTVETRILEQMRVITQTKRKGNQELIRGKLNHLLAMVKQDLAWAEVQDSYGRFYASVGSDPMPENMDSLSVADLAKELAQNMQDSNGK